MIFVEKFDKFIYIATPFSIILVTLYCFQKKNQLSLERTYYLLTIAVIAQEIHYRKAEKKARVVLAAGLPLAGFGREKRPFKEYLL